MAAHIDYRDPGPFTDLSGVDTSRLAMLGDDPIDICGIVNSLVIQPDEARTLGLATDRFDENQIRPASSLLRHLFDLDPAPVTVAREPDKRVVGTCRHFAVLSCALLRHRGIASRVRCGFATYFQPGQSLDHWITEYRTDNTSRWIRIDTEILGQNTLDHPHDLAPDDFLTGGEAWQAHRRNRIQAESFGVFGSANWGPNEIRGNAVKDLAAMNKVETLPWDEWGQMTAAYNNDTGPEYDLLLDTLADVCATDNPAAVRELYKHPQLRVPDRLIH